MQGSVISAVDLVNGLGRLAGLEVITVPGATGFLDTDYAAKGRYGLQALKRRDFLLLHIEAPDEASAKAIETRIWGVWMVSGSDTCNLLMGRAKAAADEKDYDLALKLLDAVVDGHYAAVEQLDDAIDELQTHLFQTRTDVDVRRRAYELGIPLQFVPGTGPAGRISLEDLDAYEAPSATAPVSSSRARRDGVEEVRVIGLRRKIA